MRIEILALLLFYGRTLAGGAEKSPSSEGAVSSDSSYPIDTEEKLPKCNYLLVSPPMSALEPLLQLATELASRGHHAVVASLSNGKDRVEKMRVPFLDLGSGPSAEVADLSFRKILEGDANGTKPLGFIEDIKESSKALTPYFDATDQGFRNVFGSSHDNDKMKKRDPPDVVIAVAGLNGVFDVCEELGIAFAISFPSVAMSPFVTSIPYVPPAKGNLAFDNASILHRVLKLTFSAAFNTLGPLLGYPISLVDPKHLVGHLKLVHTVPGFDFPFHAPPLLQFTGPLLRLESSIRFALSPKTKEWIEDSAILIYKLPVVYVSFGTVFFPRGRLLDTIVEALTLQSGGKDPSFPFAFRVLWCAKEQSSIQDAIKRAFSKPSNSSKLVLKHHQKLFRSVSWEETPAILSHPMVRVFLGHCGANGAHESIFLGVPIVGIPLAGDQLDVCTRLQRSGAAISLSERFQLTTEVLNTALEKTLYEPSYTRNAKKLQAIMRHYGGVRKAADLCELLWNLNGDVSLLVTPDVSDGIWRAWNVDIMLFSLLMCFFNGSLFALCCLANCGSRRKRTSKRKSE